MKRQNKSKRPLQAYERRPTNALKSWLALIGCGLSLGMILAFIGLTFFLESPPKSNITKSSSFTTSKRSTQATTSAFSDATKSESSSSLPVPSSPEPSPIIPPPPVSAAQTSPSQPLTSDSSESEAEAIAAANAQAEQTAQSLAQSAQEAGDEVHVIQK